MTKAKWKKTIIECCRAVGTYKEAFLPVVETLAATLEQRDKAYAAFKKEGGELMVEYTNKAGATNRTANPLVVLWNDLNKSALAIWKEMGLTPSGLRKIDEGAMKPKKTSALAKVLADYV